ncbi:carboxypeptidase-like regulatory domain-containing protein [Botrimarina mediterranea]|uniref:Carboxypeptidase regulatory-like domain-containing protein n=1 Tax=Botrimarina mediterranea TaxID=2528022 RepID=A0A518KAI0_9BACT|nr:carboxypeptidase-like regulatory domain-containing protein [Botrimarina mediterranea]QDV74799.1 hypothetical protein Spa11_30070 [Botrimarina mediterranea]QDV79443.1 hypothetical protein K2D_30570 [Planctomycetes bacterium K2D]
MTSKPGLGLAFVALLLSSVLLPGCGSGDFRMADVSGVVTLDGEPLSNARVQFQPQRSGESIVVGPTSFGTTDSTGRYSLSTRKHGKGAVVGTHRVSVSTFDQRLVDPQNSDRVETLEEERVPARYRAPTELVFDVPRSGSAEANFDLQSK